MARKHQMARNHNFDSRTLKNLRVRFWSLLKPVKKRQPIENLKVLPPIKRRPQSQVYPEATDKKFN